MAALSLVPLLEVAWADERMEVRERQAILAGAQASGLQAGSASCALLEGWLDQRPAPALFTAWQAYVKALVATLDADAKEALKAELLGRAHGGRRRRWGRPRTWEPDLQGRTGQVDGVRTSVCVIGPTRPAGAKEIFGFDKQFEDAGYHRLEPSTEWK